MDRTRLEFDIKVERWFSAGKSMHFAAQGESAKALGTAIGSRWRGGNKYLDVSLSRGGTDVDQCVGQIEGALCIALFEVQSSTTNFKLGWAECSTGKTLHIPSLGATHQIHAGLGEADAACFKAPGQQAQNGRLHFEHGNVGKRLQREIRIFANDHVVGQQRGCRENAEMGFTLDAHGAGKGELKGMLQPLLQRPCAEVRNCKGKTKKTDTRDPPFAFHADSCHQLSSFS